MNLSELIEKTRPQQVAMSLEEDIGEGDITARLIPADRHSNAQVITREDAVIAGVDWVNEVFKQIDPSVQIDWQVKDGDTVVSDQVLFHARGNARSLLTGERTALNWLQSLSGTATACANMAAKVAHTSVQLLDTRKTLPGLRLAQKYAVTCGGCFNHRIGLWDAFLIKENHIAACGSISEAVSEARRIAPGRPVEVETETMEELDEALKASADIIMLDEFSLEDMRNAVSLARGKAKLEASGGINQSTLVPVAETGVDYISIGSLTKDLRAVDLSMRFI